jgi:hypothetical protein
MEATRNRHNSSRHCGSLFCQASRPRLATTNRLKVSGEDDPTIGGPGRVATQVGPFLTEHRHLNLIDGRRRAFSMVFQFGACL